MSAPYGKRSVILRGHPIVNEDGVASAAITPGYLVQGVSSVAPQSADGATVIPAAFALEKTDMGTGIDSTYTTANTGVGSPNYESGEVVRVGVFHAGCRVTAWIASGVTTTEDALLSSAGDGTLEVTDASDYSVCRALEAVTATALTKIRVEVL